MLLLGIVAVGVAYFLTYKDASQNNDSANKAILSVKDLIEVKSFQEAVARNGKSEFSVSIEDNPSDGVPYYTVLISEYFADHRTVFNRYRVGADALEVYRYNVVEDSWDKL